MSLRIEKSMLNLENIVTKDKKYVEDYCYSKGVTLAFRSSAKFFAFRDDDIWEHIFAFTSFLNSTSVSS